MVEYRDAHIDIEGLQKRQMRRSELFHGGYKTFTHHLIDTTTDTTTTPDQPQQNEFRSSILNAMRGRTIIDLGCGPAHATHGPRELARLAGAAAYIGVDQKMPEDAAPLANETFVESDILDFLSQYKSPTGTFFITQGIEPTFWPTTADFDSYLSWQSPYVAPIAYQKLVYSQSLSYIGAAMSHIDRITEPSDAMLVGFTRFWHPDQYGFEEVGRQTVGNGEYTLFTKPAA